jgi:Ca-activated chloride channel family protein
MNDDKQITDAELQKLLRDIDVPEPDNNAKISALNVAESHFAKVSRTSKVRTSDKPWAGIGRQGHPSWGAQATRRLSAYLQNNKKNHQGNPGGFRLMDVLTDTFILITGGKNMKTKYVITGALGLALMAVVAAGIFSKQDLMNTEFDDVSTSLVVPEEKVSAPRTIVAAKPMVTPPAPPAPPALPPVPAAREMMPQAEMAPPATTAKRSSNMMGYSAGVSADAVMISPAAVMPSEPMPQMQNRDKFESFDENPVKSVQQDPVSTFSIDVDTSSYAVVRRALNNGQKPNKDAVRVEEMINYFDYDYPLPESREEPFKPTVALYQTPWNADTMLMHVGIKGHDLPADAKNPRSNLVFLVDVSGSMSQQDKLPLLQQAFRMLVDTLDENDTISLVTYAGQAGVALEPTKVSEKQKILTAIDNLQSGGATAGAAGIRTAYDLAEANFDKEGVNRVILATDGDFNVGITNQGQLKDYIEEKRDSGIYLSVLGFGQGNYNDALMQTLAQNGNGNAAYIDSINEARKVLVDEATSTLYPIANDVKIQVEFNPVKVAEYRLIGYETRLLRNQDFNNDKIDAGDIGAGHTVTAIYELTPVGSKAKLMDDLRYGEAHKPEAKPAVSDSNEYAFLKMRYKLPGEKTSKLITQPITKSNVFALDDLSDDIRFAGAVAAFGQLLRGDDFVSDFTYDDVLALATPARGGDPFNYRGEFLNLVRNAKLAH